MAPPGEPPTVVDTADGPTPNGPVRNTPKPWERAWNTDEMRQHSSNWTLAGDAGLLNFLQEFSQQMISKTHEVEKSIDELIHETKVTSAKVNNTINDFHMLSNMQFVESRVYDEDISEEIVAEPKKPEQKTKEQKEAELLSRIKSALHLGIQVVEQAFNRVDIQQETDSEEEEEGGRPLEGGILLEPKDPYSHRSLPYIIGSKYFHDDDYVGLSDMLSEEEFEDESKSKEYESEQSSEESESEREDKKIMSNQPASFKSPTEQHLDNVSESGSSDLFRDEKQEKDKFSDSSISADDDANEVERKKQLPKFSEELAAKLGIPSSHPESTYFDQNKGKNMDAQSIGSSDNLSKAKGSEESLHKRKPGTVGSSIHNDDEEEEEDLFGPSNTSKDSLFTKRNGLFSGGGNLFFDDQNEGDLFDSSVGPVAKQEKNSSNDEAKLIEPPKKGRTSTGKSIYPGSVSIFGDVTDVVLKMPKSSDVSPTKQSTQEDQKEVPKNSEEKESIHKSGAGLFDGSEDEDDLFASLPKKTSSISSPRRGADRNSFKSVNLFSDEDQVDGGIFEEIHTTHSSSSATPSDADPVRKVPVGGVSLFDGLKELGAAIKAKKPPGDTDSEDESIQENGSKSSHTTKTQERNDILKDSQSNSTSSSSIFTEDLESKDFFTKKDIKQTTKVKRDSLFGGDGSLFGDDDDLFAAKPSTRKPTGLSLYEDQDLFGGAAKKDEKPSQEVEPVKVEKKRTATHVSLFGDDDDEDDNDDLFLTPVNQQMDHASQKKDNIAKDTVDNVLDSEITTKDSSQSTKKAVLTATKSLFEDDTLLFGGPTSESPDVDLFSTQPARKVDQEIGSKQPPIASTVSPPETSSSSKVFKSSDMSQSNSTVIPSRDSPTKKKPIGGIALFGGIDMFKDKFSEVAPSVAEPPRKDAEQEINETESPKVVEKTSLPATLKNTEELSINFDKPVDISNTLSCASKDRVRIQARRRPPSRRSRQSSMQKSDSISPIVNANSSSVEPEIQAKPELNSSQITSYHSSTLFESSETPSKKVLSEVLTSPSTEEEDVFTAVDTLQKVVSPIEHPKQKDLFSSLSSKEKDRAHLESDVLFGPNSISSVNSEEDIFSIKRKTAVQIDTEKNDDIFSDLTVGNSRLKTDIFSSIDTTKKKTDIFDGVDEDIFSTSSLSKDADSKSKLAVKAHTQENEMFKSSKTYSQSVAINSEHTDIFADTSYDIFASIPVTEPVKLKSSSKPLFEGDDIDDLFAPVPKASPAASKLKERTSKKIHTEINNTSIFDDPLLGNQDAND